MAEKVMFAFEDIEQRRKGWDAQFRWIREVAAAYPYECTVARKHSNLSRNRYNDVSPFDHTRVRLKKGTNDYINASMVTTDKSNRRYILAQGPVSKTSSHMWQMVWEQNSKAVVMLNKTIEKGALKCHQYWPLSINKTMKFNDTELAVTLLSEENHDNYVIRRLELEKLDSTEASRTIFQFHYTSWPDFGVPESPDAFLEFMFEVQDYGVLENNVGPSVIHCSAGIGRSGTFALVETCTNNLQANIDFEVSEVLLDMRKCRMGLIQTPDQLRFSYLAITHCEEALKNRVHSLPFPSTAPHDDVVDKSEDERDQSKNKEAENVRDKTPSTLVVDENNGVFIESEEAAHGGEETVAQHDSHAERKRSLGSNGPLDVKKRKVEDAEKNSNEERESRRKKFAEKNALLRKRVDTMLKKAQENSERPQFPWKNYVIGGFVVSVLMSVAVRVWWR